MSTMHSKIKGDIKEAMKAKDTVKRDCLKNVLGKAQEMWKVQYPADDSGEISDAVMLDAIKKECKQLEQTLLALKGCDGAELFDLSKQQLDILKEYQPKQMTQQEVEEAVAWVLSQHEDVTNLGKRIGLVMKELKENYNGQFDGKMVRKVVEQYK